MTQNKPRRPSGLKAGGRALWDSIVADFEMATAEAAQLGGGVPHPRPDKGAGRRRGPRRAHDRLVPGVALAPGRERGPRAAPGPGPDLGHPRRAGTGRGPTRRTARPGRVHRPGSTVRPRRRDADTLVPAHLRVFDAADWSGPPLARWAAWHRARRDHHAAVPQAWPNVAALLADSYAVRAQLEVDLRTGARVRRRRPPARTPGKASPSDCGRSAPRSGRRHHRQRLAGRATRMGAGSRCRPAHVRRRRPRPRRTVELAPRPMGDPGRVAGRAVRLGGRPRPPARTPARTLRTGRARRVRPQHRPVGASHLAPAEGRRAPFHYRRSSGRVAVHLANGGTKWATDSAT